jgi:hypothetical protein
MIHRMPLRHSCGSCTRYGGTSDRMGTEFCQKFEWVLAEFPRSCRSTRDVELLCSGDCHHILDDDSELKLQLVSPSAEA